MGYIVLTLGIIFALCAGVVSLKEKTSGTDRDIHHRIGDVPVEISILFVVLILLAVICIACATFMVF
jgi:hypothetical protein